MGKCVSTEKINDEDKINLHIKIRKEKYKNYKLTKHIIELKEVIYIQRETIKKYNIESNKNG